MGRAASSCIAATGGIEAARLAGQQRRQHRNDDADGEADDHRSGQDGEVPGGDVEVERVEQPRQTEGEQDPAGHADEGGNEGDDQRLDDHHPGDLGTSGADGSEERELASTLGDDDAKRVGDDEGADEDRNGGERQQGDVEKAELGRDVVNRFLGLRLARDRLDPFRQSGRDPFHEFFGAHPALGFHRNRAELPFKAEEALRLGELERRQRRPEQRVVLAEPGNADELELLGSADADDGHRLAQLELALFGGRDIDHHFTRPLRIPPLVERRRVEIGLDSRREPERRRTLSSDGLPIVPHDL